jgi:PKD repeat protein
MPQVIALRIPVVLAALLCAIWLQAQAQLLPLEQEQRGSGTHQGCNPSMSVEFTPHILGGLDYRFEPQITVGENLLLNAVWSYLSNDFAQSFEDTLFLSYPAPGEYPMCLTVNAYDLLEQQPCSTTTCQLVDIVADSLCLQVLADFTIATVNGQTITFLDLSTTIASGPDLLSFWDFGDGTTSMDAYPSHTFDGNGPHRICLTVTSTGPVTCVSTTCKWLYLGPGSVDCDLLLDPGFLLVQQDNLVGVLDTSVTSGMESSIAWDFGDGTQASGRVAVHAYATMGYFELCRTVSLWGPLLNDTCQRTQCVWVDAFTAVGLEEATYQDGLRAWPVPFTERITLAGLRPDDGYLHIIDPLGREVHVQRHTGHGTVELDLGHLRPGSYVVVVGHGKHARRLRIVKQ